MTAPPNLMAHLQANASQPAQPVAPQIPPEIQRLIDNPPEGIDVDAIKGHYGLLPAVTPEQAAAVAQAAPVPAPAPAPVPAPVPTPAQPAVVPSSGKLAPPKPGETRSATAAEPEKKTRKPRSDKDKPRGARKAATTDDPLLLACAAGGLAPEQAREYLALRSEMVG